MHKFLIAIAFSLLSFGSVHAQTTPAEPIEWLLIGVLHTHRAASHNHELVTTRHKTEQECRDEGEKLDGTFTCTPVAPLSQ